jgi:hypothetical protein
METRHDISFPPYPFCVVRSAAVQGAVEKRLTKPHSKMS